MELYELGGTRWRFQGLLEALVKLERRKADVAYMVLLDRTDPEGEQNLGRFDFSQESLETVLELNEGEFTETDDEPGDGPSLEKFCTPPDEEDSDLLPYGRDLADEDGHRPEGKPAERSSRQTPDPDVLFRAGCRWLVQLAARNGLGIKRRRYRMRAWGSKGGESLLAAVFIMEAVERAGSENDRPFTPQEEQQAFERIRQRARTTALEAETDGIKKVMQLFHSLMEASVDWTIQQNRMAQATIGQMSRQLSDSRVQIDSLVGALIRLRTELGQQAIRREKDARSDSLKGTVVQEATRQLGDALKLYIMSSKDVSPEMASMMEVINRNPQLIQLLKNANVQRYLSDPEKLKGLMQLLEQMEAATNQGAGSATGPGAET